MALFGKKNKTNKKPIPIEEKPDRQPKTPSQNETSYFGKDLMIRGRVSGDGNIIILGSLDGEFNLRGRVKIAQPARIKGEVKADVISVNGTVRGSLIAKQRLQLEQTARIEGRIKTPKLSISEGAAFDGEIAMSERSPAMAGPGAGDSAAAPEKPSVPAKE